MKHKHNYLLLLLLALFCQSCFEEIEPPMSDYCDFAFFNSFTGSTAVVSQGKILTFSAQPHGETAHRWSIPQGDFFIDGDFKNNEEDYTPFIINDDTVSTDKMMTVLFDGPGGIHDVVLYNEYPEPVKFIGGKDMDTTWTVYDEERDVYIMEKIFEVDVYEKVKPICEVYTHTKETPDIFDQFVCEMTAEDTLIAQKYFSQLSEYPVEIGQVLEFRQIEGAGRPNERTWTTYKTSELVSDTAQVWRYSFNDIGSFGMSLQVKRDLQNIPGSAATTLLPVKFNVTPTKDPFELENASVVRHKLADKTYINAIALELTGASVNATDCLESFKVNVTNTNKSLENESFEVEEILVENEGSRLVLLTKEKLYDDDVFTISYNGVNGIVKTKYGRELVTIDGVVSVKPDYDYNPIQGGFNSFEGMNLGVFEESDDCPWVFSTYQFSGGTGTIMESDGIIIPTDGTQMIKIVSIDKQRYKMRLHTPFKISEGLKYKIIFDSWVNTGYSAHHVSISVKDINVNEKSIIGSWQTKPISNVVDAWNTIPKLIYAESSSDEAVFELEFMSNANEVEETLYLDNLRLEVIPENRP